MVELGVEVTDVDLQGQTNLFRFHRLLILTVLFLPLGLLVTVLAVIHDLADRGLGLGSDLHQIQTAIIGNLLRVTGAHDPQLLAVGGDDTKLFIPNLFIELDCVLFSADK